MPILVYLGYERADVYRSDPATDVAHAARPRDSTTALCGVNLGTTFDSLLFGTATPRLPSGTPKCERCRSIATSWGVE